MVLLDAGEPLTEQDTRILPFTTGFLEAGYAGSSSAGCSRI